MTQPECTQCNAYLPDGATDCPDCGHPVADATTVSSVAARASVYVPSFVASHADAVASAPGGSTAGVPSARTPSTVIPLLLVAALGAWFVIYSVLSWQAYRAGYLRILVPSWNTVIAVGMIGVVVGAVQQRAWAWQWALGIAFLNGALTALTAYSTGSSLLWVGVGVHLACGVAVRAVRAQLPAVPEARIAGSRRGQLLGTLALVASIAVGIVSRAQGTGTERGRELLVAEMQQTYDAKVLGQVRVSERGRALVIEAARDTDAQIDAAADQLQAQLRDAGGRARAWVVGFERIIVTNGTHERVLVGDAAR